MSVTKGQVIELLKSYGVSDLSVLENPEVNMQNLVFALQRSRIKVAEGFFVELANRLGLVYVTGDQLKGKSELAIALPYRILEENLSVPLEVSAEKVKIATANPLNTEFFALLEDTLRAKVEVLVASIESIDGAIGKGYEDIHKYRALRDLRYRDPDESAYRVLYAWQREFLIGTLILIIIIFVFNYPLSFIVVIAAINILYFCVNPVKFYIAFRGFKRSSRSVYVSNDDLLKLDESTLPEYTILIPIYHEAQVLPHIIENIYRIDYPRDKLDVKILMEEKDQETIAEARRLGLFGKPQTVVAPIISLGQSSEHVKILELGPSIKVIDSEATTVGTLDSVVTQADGGAILNVKRPNGEIMQIPEGFVRSVGDVVRLEDTLDVLLARYMDALGVFDAVVVPDAEIRTKPRACNYGLLRARGEYCVIYDAEDDPEPDQLKKAAVAFSRLPEQCVCLQSRLNFYNPKENILTRWFSLEYGYWFDFYLEGLDQVGIFRDVTERRQVEGMKDQFVSMVSHELRTPLTSIRASLGLLASGVIGALPEKGQRMLDIAVTNTDRLVRLINDILDSERLASGKTPMEKKQCSTAQLVKQASDVMKPMAEKAGVSFSVESQDAALWVDPDRIVQALTNLISNAIKFSPKGGRIWVAAERKENQMLFRVQDEGGGIPPDKLGLLFERFQQLDSSDAREKGGSGLGLSISRSIVEQHNGKIWIESTVGKGSTFFFTIPLPLEEVPLQPEATTGAPTTRKVLIIEDDPDLANILAAMLQRHDIQPHIALTGGKGIALSKQIHPNLIVLDLILPDMDGSMVVEGLRKDNILRSVPLVVYTVKELDKQQRENLRLGETLFFTKSRIPPEQFEEKVVQFMERILDGGGRTSVN